MNVFQGSFQQTQPNFLLTSDDSYQSSRSIGERNPSQNNRKPPISARQASDIHTGVRSRIDTGLGNQDRQRSVSKKKKKDTAITRTPEILDMFNQPRQSKASVQTPAKPKGEQISRDGSMKGSKKSRNTEQKGKTQSRNQLSFAEESKLHENANLIFSSRKSTLK